MRRGRPRAFRPETDLGTPELQMKRILRVTDETLDVLLEKEIITQEQHWCGMHFRWLYTLRYGAPSARTTELVHGRMLAANDDPEWRTAREQEFHTAAAALKSAGVSEHVMNLLLYTPNLPLQSCYATVPYIRDGLNVLADLWCNSGSGNHRV